MDRHLNEVGVCLCPSTIVNLSESVGIFFLNFMLQEIETDYWGLKPLKRLSGGEYGSHQNESVAEGGTPNGITCPRNSRKEAFYCR